MSRIILAFLLVSAWLWPAAAANAQPASRVAVSLHASSADPAPGRTTMLAIRFIPDRGWHGYWSNPGDSGLPPSDVLVFRLDGGRRVIMRPSGTEPKLKSYYEVRVPVAEGEELADARVRGLAELAALRDAHQLLLRG